MNTLNTFRRPDSFTTKNESFIPLLELNLQPALAVASIFLTLTFKGMSISSQHYVLAMVVWFLSQPSNIKITDNWRIMLTKTVLRWLFVFITIATFELLTRGAYLLLDSSNVRTLYFIVTPVIQFLGALLLKKTSPYIIKVQSNQKRIVIIGLNEQTFSLYNAITNNVYEKSNIIGYFNDSHIAIKGLESATFLGSISQSASYISQNNIDVVYISLPSLSETKKISLIKSLGETTASIYIVPDLFLTDIIQSRSHLVGGIPVISVCETPFVGWAGIVKNSTDFLLAIIALCLISPVMLLISVAIKLDTEGPIIFKQRRYGLDGKEILVYKFRSMSCFDDSNNVPQATKNDPRVTRIGKFLRKTSLDELPQFINVLEGKMSIVGPRPHAVAHNEFYKKVIQGYMIRHKVKPGITGWAQVNGLRGETETIDIMKQRLIYDLDYLRNWTPLLDWIIMLKTGYLLLIKRDAKAL